MIKRTVPVFFPFYNTCTLTSVFIISTPQLREGLLRITIQDSLTPASLSSLKAMLCNADSSIYRVHFILSHTCSTLIYIEKSSTSSGLF